MWYKTRFFYLCLWWNQQSERRQRKENSTKRKLSWQKNPDFYILFHIKAVFFLALLKSWLFCLESNCLGLYLQRPGFYPQSDYSTIYFRWWIFQSKLSLANLNNSSRICRGKLLKLITQKYLVHFQVCL